MAKFGPGVPSAWMIPWKAVVYRLALRGLVGGEDVIEGAVLANDYDHVLNGGLRRSALDNGWSCLGAHGHG